MSARKAASAAQKAVPSSDDTADRIRAYLASMRPTRGVVWNEDVNENIHRGRSRIEHLALSAAGTGDPTLKLSAKDCADILCFIARSEPLDLRTWWTQPLDQTSHVCGFIFVLEAVERYLRGKAGRP